MMHQADIQQKPRSCKLCCRSMRRQARRHRPLSRGLRHCWRRHLPVNSKAQWTGIQFPVRGPLRKQKRERCPACSQPMPSSNSRSPAASLHSSKLFANGAANHTLASTALLPNTLVGSAHHAVQDDVRIRPGSHRRCSRRCNRVLRCGSICRFGEQDCKARGIVFERAIK